MIKYIKITLICFAFNSICIAQNSLDVSKLKDLEIYLNEEISNNKAAGIEALIYHKGEIVWQVPLGEYEELTKQGFSITGTENYGGPILTDGGLIFIGATNDEYFRAFDKKTGEEIWKTKLPAGGYATPITYQIDGKQYVVIACGGGKMGTKSGDSYLAFALN